MSDSAEMATLKAYRVWLWGEEGIYFAKDRGQARYIASLNADDAGYHNSLLHVTSCRRAPEFDCIARPMRYGWKVEVAEAAARRYVEGRDE